MSFAVYFINRPSVSTYSGDMLYCFWCRTPTLGFTLGHRCVFECAAYASLLETLQDGKLAPSGIADMHVGYDLRPSLEGGICI